MTHTGGAHPLGNSVGLTGVNVIDGLTQGSSWELPSSRTLTFSLWDSEDGSWPLNTPTEVAEILLNFSIVANINFSFFGQFPVASDGQEDDRSSNNSSDISITASGNSLSSALDLEVSAFSQTQLLRTI